MTTFFVIGDPHFQEKNMKNINLFIDKILPEIKSRRPDYIVILGDFLHDHERLHTLPLNKAYEFINSLRDITTVYILVGNHDMINNSQFLNDNHWMNCLKGLNNVVIVDKITTLKTKQNYFLFSPYIPTGRFKEALNTIPNWKEANVIFAHQEFKGCSLEGRISEEGDKWSKKYPYVISGHIHLRHSPQENIFYPGSILQHSFEKSRGEVDKHIHDEIPSIVLYTKVDGNDREMEMIDLKLPKKLTKTINLKEIEDIKIVSENEDELRLRIKSTEEEFKQFKQSKKYKDLLKENIKVIYVPIKKETKRRVEEGLNFFAILKELIERENDKYLLKTYNKVLEKE